MTYISKRKDRVKQIEARDAMRGRRKFAVLMGMRTGKSKVIVDDFGEMVDRGDALDLLVIAPGGAYRPWVTAVSLDFPDDLLSRTKILTWVSRSARTKRFSIERDQLLDHRGPRVLIMNVEALSSVAGARDLCSEFLSQRRQGSVCSVDESVAIKEPTSNCGKFVTGQLSALAGWRRIMSGLVSPRSPLDLWNQYNFLDPTILGYPRFTEFRARYAKVRQVCMLPNAKIMGMLRSRLGLAGYLTNSELFIRCKVIDPELNVNGLSASEMRDFIATMADSMPRDKAVEVIQSLGGYIETIPMIDGYQNLDELRAKTAPHSYRCRLEDCYDMPASDYSFRDVEMTDEQRRLYGEIREKACAQLESLDYVTATHVITRMLRLHQVLCGHVVDENGKLHEVPERRTAEIVETLSDYEGKAVIWCSYDYNVRRVSVELEKAFGKGSVARFWGGNVGTREAEEVQFKNDLDCRFMVATPDAGKYGRDWSVANLTLFYSQRNNLDHRQQSEDRTKADGKMIPNAYIDFRVPGTIEDRIIECLRTKMDMAAVINGDNWREWLV